jgi:hypothetical protein
MPLTIVRPSTEFQGRRSMICWARSGPDVDDALQLFAADGVEVHAAGSGSGSRADQDVVRHSSGAR